MNKLLLSLAMFLLSARGVESKTPRVFFAPVHAIPSIVDFEKRPPFNDGRKTGIISFKPHPDGVTFNIKYSDINSSTGIGFDDPLDGLERRQTLEAVLTYIDSVLDYQNVELDIEINSLNTSGSALAFGGTYFREIEGFQDGFTIERFRTGVKPDPLLPEISITVDFGYNYYNGLGDPASNQYDLFSVLLHEFGHGFGFVGFTGFDGTSNVEGAEVFSRLDELFAIPESGGTALTGDPPVFIGDVSRTYGGRNSLQVRSPLAHLSYGSSPFIHTPNPYLGGSSVSHWQGDIGQNRKSPAVSPVIFRGFKTREFIELELATFQDMGLKTQVDLSYSDIWQLY